MMQATTPRCSTSAVMTASPILSLVLLQCQPLMCVEASVPRGSRASPRVYSEMLRSRRAGNPRPVIVAGLPGTVMEVM
jgi:hypothetical protein